MYRSAQNFVCVFFIIMATRDLGATPVQLERENDQVRIFIDGIHFTTYHTQSLKCPYLFPILTRDGRHLTRRWPLETGVEGESKDHPHHIGMHFAHGAVAVFRDGKVTATIDYWHAEGRIRHEGFLDFESQSKAAAIKTRNSWLNASGEAVATDVRTISFGRDEHGTWIYWEITIQAPETHSLVMGDTKEGTMSLRLPDELAMAPPEKKGAPRNAYKGSLINSEGQKGKDLWGKRARWCAAYGPLQGKGVVIAGFDHPENPRYPTWWMARPYGLFSFNRFGLSYFEKKPRGTGNIEIKANETLTLRYRFLFSEATFTREAIDKAYAAYTGPLPGSVSGAGSD